MEEIKTEQEISFIEKTEETDGKTFETGAKEYPLVALRGKVLFPNTILNFDVGRPVSVSAIEEARVYDNYLFIATQKNAFIDNPTKRDINNVGVIAKIKQVAKLSNGNMKVSVEALRRGRITLFTQDKGCFKVMAEAYPYEDHAIAEEVEAYFRVAKGAFYEFTLFEKRITKDMLSTITAISNPNNFIDNAMSLVNLKEEDCLNILETTETKDRLIAFEKLFSKEVEIAKIEKRIASKVRTNIDESQKEFYLCEQLKAIHSELGDEDDGNELKERIKEKKLPKEIEEKALKEVERLDKINPSSPDYSIILNYLDWLLGVPFNECTEDNNDLKKAVVLKEREQRKMPNTKPHAKLYLR